MRKVNGFTLIELMVVVAIMGILAAIATAGFTQYRQRGHDASANLDLRSAATAQEAQYVDTASYISCTDVTDCNTKLVGIDQFSDKTLLSMDATGAETFEGESASSYGSGKSFLWNNTTGLTIVVP